jgi:hypothetical protein
MSSCEDIVKKVFPEKYEIRSINDLGDKCLVDFKDKEMIVDVDFSIHCEEKCLKEGGMDIESEEFAECVDDCIEEGKDTVERAKLGSVLFRKDNLQLEESTIPISCDYVWESEGLEEALRDRGIIGEDETWQDYADRIKRKFKNLGCYVADGWIHPHELINLGIEVEEEPAACYIHLSRSINKDAKRVCSIADVFKELDKLKV